MVPPQVSLLVFYGRRSGLYSPSLHCYIAEMPTPTIHEALAAFVAERDWAQFHTPENLAKSISIEAAELLELFQWSPDADEQQIQDELADVLTYAYLLAARLKLNPDDIVRAKLAKTREKYPVEKSRGTSTKYDQL